MSGRSLALVGAAGGVGTTRLSIEAAAGLAADGHNTILIDCALETQGMAAYLPDRIEPDVTAVLLEDAALDAAVHDFPADTDGRFGVCPAFAPFTKLASAQAPEAAQRIESILDTATDLGEYVILDVPPIASNVAVAAVTAADHCGIVTTPTQRGRDALARTRGRLADVGASEDFVVGNFGTDPEFSDADVVVPQSRVADIPETPTVLGGDDGFGPGIATLLEAGFELSLSVSLDTGLVGTAKEYLPSEQN